MKVFLIIAVFLFTTRLTIPVAKARESNFDKYVEFHGPNIRPGYPDAFHLYHRLSKDMVSPDGRFGIIYPSPWLIDSPPADYFVAIRESRIVGLIETDRPYFSGVNGNLAANWSPDSLAVFVQNDGKWLPHNLIVIELANGEIVRQTQIADPLLKMFSPAIAKAAPERRKDASVDHFTIDAVTWKNGHRQLEIRCLGMTNPKAFPEEDQWTGELVAVWHVLDRKFIHSSVKQISFRKGQPGQ
jgi:hypothetical protein